MFYSSNGLSLQGDCTLATEHILTTFKHLWQRVILEMIRLFTAILTGANSNVSCDVHASPTIAKVTQSLESEGPHSVPESTLIQQVTRQAEVAQIKPQAAHTAFTHSLTRKWTFLTDTINVTKEQLQPLEDAMPQRLVPSLTGHSPSGNEERDLLALPPRPL